MLAVLPDVVSRPLVTMGKHGVTISSPKDLTFNADEGRVGIGTSDPAVALHVARAAKVSGTLQLGHTDACGPDNKGSLRYQGDYDRVEICSGELWVAVSSEPVGSIQSAAPSTCGDVFSQNQALQSGSFFLRDADTGIIQDTFCTKPEPQEQLQNLDLTNPMRELVGCTIPIASNYEKYATAANNSMCIVYGCDDPAADNYLSVVTANDGSCFIAIYGCRNENAPNYNPTANVDDETCFEMCIKTSPCVSCLVAYDHQKPTGVYWIGESVTTAELTYCFVLTANDGGWTLLMKAKPGNTFNYGASYWTDINVLNVDTEILNPDTTVNMYVDAKYDVYNWMPATEYMAYFPDGNFFWRIGPFEFDNLTTPREFFQINRLLSDSVQTLDDWNPSYFSRVFDPVTGEPERQDYGINVDRRTDGVTHGAIRWGYSWAASGDQEHAGGGIGRKSNIAAGTFSAGDWYQYGGVKAPNGDREFSVQIFAR
jgi:hypothetical protein